MKVRAAVAVVGAVLAVASQAAASTTTLDEVATALRSDPVFVDPDSEQAISDDAAQDLREDIRNGGTPVFVAIVPGTTVAEVGGDPNDVVRTIAETVRLPGTYAVVAGDSFRAGSSLLPQGRASELATAAFQARADDGVEAVLRTFVDDVQGVAADAGAVSGGGDGSDDGGGVGWGGILLLAGAGGVGAYAWSRSRRRRAEQAEARREYEADRQLLEAEVSVLASDVVALDSEVTLHPDAAADYEAATTRFRVAQSALEQADEQVDLVRVRRLVDEGRYAMERVKARVEGREPPRPPEELQRPGRHEEPALDLDERGEPTYVGRDGFTGYGPFYGGGWFMGANGLFTGLLLGSLLGGWGHAGPIIVQDGGGGVEGGGDWGGGGDFGGGDWGGGDFGGGDFGG
ncbi:MAG TPA: hypothetical protein VG478_15205 [Acidimicrobiales bacterium]|nr:hypothetical protein [Acidimicrobiales bacterium]